MSLLLKKKGGKGFAPKFPLRRHGAPSSTQSSARPSVERQSQTPAPQPHTVDAVIIPDDDGTPDLVDDAPRTVENRPHQLVPDISKDVLPHARSGSEPDALAPSADSQNGALLLDNGGLKRKTRGQDAVVAGVVAPRKRRQLSSPDAPNCPPHPVSNEQIPSGDSQLQLTHSPITKARCSLPMDLETQTIVSRQPPQAEAPAAEVNAAETVTILEVSQVINQLSEPTTSSTNRTSQLTATTSSRHPLPDNTRSDSNGESDLEATGNGLGPAGDIESGAASRTSARTPVIVPMATLDPDGIPGELAQQTTPASKKGAPKRRKGQAAEDFDSVRATVEMEPNRPPQAQSKTPRKRKKDYGQKKSKRAETPEDAENEEIDREEIKVVELCKDLRIGKKFTRHDELRQRLKEKLMKTQLASIDPELVSAVVGAGGGGEGHCEAREEEERPALQSTGPQMKIVGDQIVMDNDTLQLDRHKRAQDAQDAQGPIEEVIEDDFSKIITCGTHMKRERAQLWDAASNEIFWKGLRMFGTDFEMIAKLFPSRTRRQIKLKFNKEERDNPTRIDRILRGIGSSIDLDTYEELSGVKLEDVAAIDAERERIEAEQKAEEDKRIAEHAEAEKKKKEAIAAQRAAQRRILGIDEEEDGDPGEKENQELPPGIGEKSLVSSKNPKKGKKHGASGKQKKNRTAADETVQVLGDA